MHPAPPRYHVSAQVSLWYIEYTPARWRKLLNTYYDCRFDAKGGLSQSASCRSCRAWSQASLLCLSSFFLAIAAMHQFKWDPSIVFSFPISYLFRLIRLAEAGHRPSVSNLQHTARSQTLFLKVESRLSGSWKSAKKSIEPKTNKTCLYCLPVYFPCPGRSSLTWFGNRIECGYADSAAKISIQLGPINYINIISNKASTCGDFESEFRLE